VTWLIKTGDAERIAAQAQIDGVTLPTWTWDACGGPYNWLCWWPGAPAAITAAENGVWQFVRFHTHGTVFYDLESWQATPNREKANPLYWLCRAAKTVRAAHKPGVHLIETPLAHTAAAIQSEDVQAVKCGVFGVDIQSQFADGKPAHFKSFVSGDIEAMRDVRKSVVILVGLATNGPAGYLAATTLVRDYRYAIGAGANGIWLNAADWMAKNKCGAAQGGPGCPQIAIEFLKAIGAAT
jgi:hypothetical protein